MVTHEGKILSDSLILDGDVAEAAVSSLQHDKYGDTMSLLNIGN